MMGLRREKIRWAWLSNQRTIFSSVFFSLIFSKKSFHLPKTIFSISIFKNDIAKWMMALREEKINQVFDLFTLFTGFFHHRFQKWLIITTKWVMASIREKVKWTWLNMQSKNFSFLYLGFVTVFKDNYRQVNDEL